MCGILFTNDRGIEKDNFIKALSLMEHRGPDVPLCYASYKQFKLGHNRLKIIDLDNRSNQPFYSRDGRYIMVYNGEIYNYKELAREHGIKMSTTGDTELLLSLYIKYGPKMLGWLNGMFSLVILDTATEDIFASRDRLGVKPLYYYESDSRTIFSSEISAIIDLTGKTEIDDIGLRQYKKLRIFFNGRTLYSSIKMFPAGHYLLNGKILKYWELQIEDKEPPKDEELRFLIESAVSYRCISDVPVGSYLSGGVDSTIVAGLASEPHTWTVGFFDNNEFNWGKLAAKKFHSRHHEIIIKKDEFLPLATSMIKKRREPLSVPNEVLLYKMTKAVKEFNTVVLSGEGADELLFGYDRIFRWAAESVWDLGEFSELYSYGSNSDLEIVEDAVSPFYKYGKAINIVAAFFQVAHLHGLLRRLDNSTMLCAVEARVPFVDYRLVERLAGVPFDYKMPKGVVKGSLKRIFSDLIPAQIIDRPKVGFPVNLNDIFGLKKTDGNGMDKWFEFNLNNL